MQNKKGQSHIELLVVSFVLITLVKGILILFWIFTNFLWMEHQLYQGLICRAEKRPISMCKTKVLNQIKKLNQIGEFTEIKLAEFNNQWKGHLKWRFYKWTFTIKSQLNLKNL